MPERRPAPHGRRLRHTRRRLSAWAALLCSLSLLVSGCEISFDADGKAGTSAGQTPTGTGTSSTPVAPMPTAPPIPARVVLSPSDKAVNVPPNAAVTASAQVGTLSTVTLTDANGAKVPGAVDPVNGIWRASSRLRPSTSYVLTAQATGPTGLPSTTTAAFRTLKPKITATYAVLYDGSTVGVGMPVTIQFDTSVATTAQRAAIEKSLTVRTTPAQAGAWGWLDDRQLMYRPKSYWRPGTRITLDAPLTGLQTGAGKWIAKDATGSWSIGPSMVSTVDMKTHKMTVRRNGAVVKTFPVSTGRPGPKTETRYGTKVIIERVSAMTMDSATVGIPKGKPGYYRIDTKWNMRVTWTGEFLHSAPWSTSSQGTANVSHGCTNLSPSAAQWMFANSRAGDVVTFTGSSRAFQPTEGIGVWVYSWAGWQAQSALV